MLTYIQYMRIRRQSGPKIDSKKCQNVWTLGHPSSTAKPWSHGASTVSAGVSASSGVSTVSVTGAGAGTTAGAGVGATAGAGEGFVTLSGAVLIPATHTPHVDP